MLTHKLLGMSPMLSGNKTKGSSPTSNSGQGGQRPPCSGPMAAYSDDNGDHEGNNNNCELYAHVSILLSRIGAMQRSLQRQLREDADHGLSWIDVERPPQFVAHGYICVLFGEGEDLV